MSGKYSVSRFLWLVMLGSAGVVVAGESGRVEKTFKTTENPRISLSNLKGTIVIRGWDKSEVHAICITTSPRVEIDCEQMPAAGEAEKVHFATHLLDQGSDGLIGVQS